jgi:uncharacterized membrane protein YdbT with pleckstrin-like domain
MKNDDQSVDPQPVAYDAQGRALYHHPQGEAAQRPVQSQPASLVSVQPDAYEGHDFNPKIRAQYANEPDYTHTTREYEPAVPEISEPLRRKHEESVALYPSLNLTKGEFVMLRIKRHPIGLFIPVFVTVFTLIVLTTVLILMPDIYGVVASNGQLPTEVFSIEAAIGVVLLLMFLIAVIGGAAIWIYIKNQFFLTNEAVIQEIQYGLFSRREQTVSLGSIEDASYRQQGILQHIFDYGTMRLSTEGEETTYRFAYVENPKKQIATVNNAVESFKNGRPVGAEFLD